VTYFFSLAPSVYQQVEGLMDTTAVEAVSTALLEPDLVLVLESDPRKAAARAVPHRPGPREFFSPYVGTEQFRRAQDLYRGAVDWLRGKGLDVHVVEDSAAALPPRVRRLAAAAAKGWT
jgi:thymidylate kinase